jgi:hypothetical protein
MELFIADLLLISCGCEIWRYVYTLKKEHTSNAFERFQRKLLVLREELSEE